MSLPIKAPPTRQKLEMLLMNHEETFITKVQSDIEEHNLPYYVEDTHNPDTTKRFVLRNKFTRGETYLNSFITRDLKMIEVKYHATKFMATEHPVLISGPTGTGKEILAKSMIGTRQGEVKAVNCAGLPSELIESELFGHVQGAFTGADRLKQGLIKEADNGVMFLDEIGDMPLMAQAKLLRVLQEKVIRKVGGNKDETVNCKFVFATNCDLKEMVKKGTFREDLYARISILELFTTPLVDRMDDVIPIVKSMQGGEAFLAKYQTKLLQGVLDLSCNVRSLEKYVIQFNVLGEVPNVNGH
jgi:transcriptional regulator with PAS, ATPase and Fis domain